MYSIALGQRCFKWKMLGFSGPMALLFLKPLIAFITRPAVNVRAISNGFLLVSPVTTRVSPEEVCPTSFEVLNYWLNLLASCLDDENEIPLKVIASFSASRFALPSIPLIVLHILVRSVFWTMVSIKCLHFWSLLIGGGHNSSTALSQACRKRRLFGVFGNVIIYFLIMFLYYQICVT